MAAECLSSANIAAVVYIHHCHDPVLVVDPVDDPVRTAPRAEPIVHRRQKPLADPIGLLPERAGDELVGCCRNGRRQNLAQGAA
jgi:hypothetical protein